MVALVPIEQRDFDVFLENEIHDYAQEKIISGNWLAEEALEKSQVEFMSLLLDGLQTKDQFVFSVLDEDTNLTIGVLWIQVKMGDFHRKAFICDFVIQPEFRGNGFGKQALQTLDKKLEEMGVVSVSLHVFAHNTNAIALYEKAGYKVTNLYMGKAIENNPISTN
jgi:ribosomal protein S18 acetylase RimI-like enzyme